MSTQAISENTIQFKTLKINFLGIITDCENKELGLDIATEILKNISIHKNKSFRSFHNNEEYIIEAFFSPLVALSISKTQEATDSGQVETILSIKTQYELSWDIDLKSLCLDEWDNFHGLTKNGIPFALNLEAQDQLFKLCDSFDDDFIVINNIKIPTPDYYNEPRFNLDPNSWDKAYEESSTPWDISKAAPILPVVLNKIKIQKSRIIVLGCGRGHDAAFLAEQGHVVTAVDFSEKSITEAKKLYGHIKNLDFIQKDIFNLPEEWTAQFDIVWEHTCFAAIAPANRKKLIMIWRKLLHEQGHIMGVFFVMNKRSGPPYSINEWALDKTLSKHLHFLYWQRLNEDSPKNRTGTELFVYAKKR